jgi:GMP synthase-like glutamine amidotransferase
MRSLDLDFGLTASGQRDKPRLALVDNGSLSTEAVVRSFCDLGMEVAVYLPNSLPEPSDVDGVVLSGTRTPAWLQHYAQEVAFVRDCGVPLLGICGGLHIIARAFGVELQLTVRSIGRQRVDLDVGDPLFAGLPSAVELFKRHTYRLTKVPHGFTRIAWSQVCPIEAVAHCSRPIWGIQAHPEFRRSGRAILSNFAAVVAAGSTPVLDQGGPEGCPRRFSSTAPSVSMSSGVSR